MPAAQRNSASGGWEWPSSLWVETATPPPETAALQGDVQVTTAVVGAGFTGLRAALALSEAGQQVAVLEAREVGWGASGRNGGQVNPMPPVNSPEQVAKLAGPAHFERLAAAYLGSADEVFSLIERYGIDCQARQSGWLRVDHCAKAKESAWAIAEGWVRHGAEIDFLEGRELQDATGSAHFQSGMLIRKGGALQPLSYARGLARAAQAAGAAIYSDTPALAIEAKDKRWVIRTPHGRVEAEHVVLCTNGYSDGLWPGLAESVIPLVSIQAASEPLTGNVAKQILPAGHTVSDTRRTIIYGRREPDGRILFGSLGSIAGGSNDAAFKAMRQEVEEIFPSLRGVRWDYRWGGQIAVTRDHLPHLHEPAPGVFAGLGYNGRGVAMGTVMGRVLAERVLGKPATELPFPVSPIRSYPFHRFHRLGVDMVVWWMRRKDRLEARRG